MFQMSTLQMKTCNLVIVLVTCFTLSGCGDKDKKDFMAGCTDGSTNELAVKLCSCAYGKMKFKYGGDSGWMEKALQSSPQEFTAKMNETVTSCMQ